MMVAAAMGISSLAFAANPFSDVPQGHWAYASFAQLSGSGILEAYPDSTFAGERTMTRYEMAQIVAKALAKGAIGADDRLVAEFAEELDQLGVRVAALESRPIGSRLRGGSVSIIVSAVGNSMKTVMPNFVRGYILPAK